jgi:hypothetical protein
LNISTAKLLGNFYNNRQSAANSFLRFAYSFVFFMLHQYYWRCDLFSANRQSAANKKISAKTSYWRCEFATLLLLAQRRRRASPLSRGCNLSANNSAKTVACSASLICLELAYKFDSTDRKQKYGKNKMKVNQNEKIMSSATI